MLDLKLKLYNSINLKLDSYPDFLYTNENANINYDSILKIWSDFVFKNYSDLFPTLKDDKIFKEESGTHQNIIDLCKNNLELALVLEDLFKYHITCPDDDLIIFYLKGSNKVLLKLKSFGPLLYDNEKVMPFWNIYIKQKDFIESIENYLENTTNDNLCILCF
jgi:hypothetical protein